MADIPTSLSPAKLPRDWTLKEMQAESTRSVAERKQYLAEHPQAAMLYCQLLGG